MMEAETITEDWLKSVGFKWHELERQGSKHWLLWLGDAVRAKDGSLTSYEDIGIEVAPSFHDKTWFCWFRSDGAGRYHRFIHLRHIEMRGELIALAEAISGQPWNPENHINGCCMSPAHAERARSDWNRLDRELMREGYPWSKAEEDETRGGALPEHLADYIEHREPKAKP